MTYRAGNITCDFPDCHATVVGDSALGPFMATRLAQSINGWSQKDGVRLHFCPLHSHGPIAA